MHLKKDFLNIQELQSFKMENNFMPPLPKTVDTVCIELMCSRAPMSPAPNNNKQPIMWPMMMANRPSENPRGAK